MGSKLADPGAITWCLERSCEDLRVGKFLHITEPILEHLNAVTEELGCNGFVISHLKLFQFGLLRAFNRLESLFIRPPGPGKWEVWLWVGVGLRVNLYDVKKIGSCFGLRALHDRARKYSVGR